MKLNIMGIEDSIEINDYSNSLLVIENHRFFAHIIKTLYEIINNRDLSNELVLLDGHTNVLKNALIFTDPFMMDFGERYLLKKLYDRIEKNILNSEDEWNFIRHIEGLNTIVQDSLEEINIDFSFRKDIFVSEYLKLIGLKMQNSAKTIFESTINYLELLSKLSPNSVCIFVNCLGYYEDDEIREICKFKNYEHLYVLFIESGDKCFDFDFFDTYNIDRDYYLEIRKAIQNT